MYEFILPDLGEGIHEAEILTWYVSPGDEIEEDGNLVNLETDKAAVTIPSPKGGKVVETVGKPGDIVSVGQVIARIAVAGEEDGGKSQHGHKSDTPSSPPPAVSHNDKAEVKSQAPREKGPVPAAPATRRLARKLGVDLHLVTPTGPGGRVTGADVRAFSKVTPTAVAEKEERIEEKREDRRTEASATLSASIPFLEVAELPDYSPYGPVEVESLRSIRRKVAKHMVTSMVLVPHVAHMDEIDVTELEEFRKREKEKLEDTHLTLLSFVVRAVVAALKEFPSFNASLDPVKQEIIYKKFYNLGIAVDSGKGLIVPVIKDADRKSILAISKDISSLAEKARNGKIEVADLQGGTFTITNVGPLGGTAMIPTINYPEVAILGMGRVQEKPVVRNGEIVIRKMLPITLAFDHRVADGADAARFANKVVSLLSSPSRLLLET